MPDKKKKIETIQIIRLIGAISIILFHSGSLGSYGYFAVEIFCVLSGYILMYSTCNEESKKCFLRKRLFRIVPLYWICTVIMYILIIIMPQLSVMSEAKPEYLIKSLFFIPFVNSKGFDVPIVGVGWTLIYEVFFYFIFYIALMINHKYRGIIATIIISSLGLLNYLFSVDNVILKYLSDSFMLEFVYGIIAFYLVKGIKKYTNKKAINYILVIAGVVSLLWMVLDIGVDTGIARSLRLGIPAFVFFVSALVVFEKKTYPSILVELGNATFAIYLLEFFTTAIYKVVIGFMPIFFEPIICILMVFATLALGLYVYKYIETPLYKKLQNTFCK